jgi:hypothetical protein
VSSAVSGVRDMVEAARASRTDRRVAGTLPRRYCRARNVASSSSK